MFGDFLQPTHLLFVMAIALLVLGPKRLPEVGRQLGKGLRDFRDAMSGVQQESHGLFEQARVPLTTPTEQPVAQEPAAVAVAPTVTAEDAAEIEPIPEEHREAAAAHAEQVAAAAQTVASSSPASAAPAPSDVPAPPA